MKPNVGISTATEGSCVLWNVIARFNVRFFCFLQSLSVITSMKDSDLVIAKNTFSTERTVEFKQGKKYRVCKMDGGFLVYGEWFSKDEFNQNFSPLIDVIKEEWEMIGITVGGKLVSKKAFSQLSDVHTYGKGINAQRCAYFQYQSANVLVYKFNPRFAGDTKKQVLDDAYDVAKRCLNGEVYEWFDEFDAVQRGNSGIGYNVRWREVQEFSL
jgi:hypothetical protein